jgi:hypothetical protein
MPKGRFGVPRPLARCRIVFVIIGNEQDLPTAMQAEGVIASDAPQFFRNNINNVLVDRVNTNNFTNMMDRGSRKAVLVEVQYNNAINLNRFGRDIADMVETFERNFNSNTFAIAR